MIKKFLAGRRLGQRGTAAVEFALVAPLLLVLFIGTQEMLLLYRTQAKLNAMASSVAQMMSLQAPLTSGASLVLTPVQIADVCKGASYGLQPFPPNGLSVAIASLTKITAASVNNAGVTTAPANYDYWENDTGCGATAAPINFGSGTSGICTQAGQLTNPQDNIIEVRGTLAYPGVVGLVLGTRPTLQQTAYARWRYANNFPAPAELTCAGCTTPVPAAPQPCPAT
jgi:Flp pilus assembly protein TadG